MNAQDGVTAVEKHQPRPASVAWIDALTATSAIDSEPHHLLPGVIGALALSRPGAPALLSDRECFTFAELSSRMRSYQLWAMANGLAAGDCVALVMSNRPEYVAIWLGLSRLGIVTALINTSLAGPSLAHCLSLAAPRHIIAEDHFASACRDASHGLGNVTLWCHGEACAGARPLLADLDDQPTELSILPRVTLDDTALLIYTSGTTGLPKAAKVSHRRVLHWALWFKGMLGNTAADRMYDCLPLYHSVGGVVAVAAALVAGGSTVIAPKFSASRFWDDIRRWDCTQFQYIGELCRYLLNAPPHAMDGIHHLRAVCGNGLRADVWDAFRERFNIPAILEFYAATEGNFSLFNAEGRPGAIGRIPPFLRHRFPTAIVRFDHRTGEPERDGDGHCIRAAIGEAGEALGRIGDGKDGTGRFEGYTSTAESERKVLRSVFADGDMWFRTGDLMRADAAGYFYFADRIGDTFRWKGENVSTLEVANALASAPHVLDAVVYGVAVPQADGRAGMAMLLTEPGFSLAAFRNHAAARLPSYALPVFVRLGGSLSATETFKHRKVELLQDGFDPSLIADPVHVWNAAAESYQPVDEALFATIMQDGLRP